MNEEVEKKITLEACVESIQECLKAEKLGADRVELCADLAKGGTTPSYGLVKRAKEILSVPIFVIIRPRAENFVYDDDEMHIMKNDILMFKSLGVNGFVFGVLNEENEIDIEKNEELIKIINDGNNKPNVTFHMAFDKIKDENKNKSIDQLIDLGFNRILTKGCNSNSIDGLENIKQYNKYANGRIIILPGGGVTKDNFKYIIDSTGCIEAHGTKIVGLINV